MQRPLRYPIIFRDLIFATRNTKLAFHLRELQFASLRGSPPHPLRPLFTLDSQVSFHPAPSPFKSHRFLLSALRLLSDVPSTLLAVATGPDHIDFITFPHTRHFLRISRRVTIRVQHFSFVPYKIKSTGKNKLFRPRYPLENKLVLPLTHPPLLFTLS